jgi:RNA polymerase sigma factor (sigma-70 family)
VNSLADQQLLRDYSESRSEAAFAELVRRHVDQVFSAALRMVRDSHLAEDVTQGVFVALARHAGELTDRPVLSGWLHRTAQNLAANAVRSDVRRRAREQEVAAMNELLATEPDALWEHVAPHLDAALGELSEADRDALLLRYFERKSAREMAQTLGTSEDAAQKRVSRAVERLRELFSNRNVTIGASGLVVVISANAVQAAPVGLAAAISATAVLAGTTVASTATATAAKAIAMTTLQKALIAATIAAVGTGIYEGRQVSSLRTQVQTLQQQQMPLAEQIRELQRARDEATNRLAMSQQENAQLKQNTAELLKLRGEMARLKAAAVQPDNDSTKTAAQSWLSRVGQLKQRLAQDPTAKIPELRFVTEQDWLNAAREELHTEADYRRALSTLRSAGESQVASMLKKGLTGYMRDNSGQMPTDFAQLQPYFDSPVEDAILQRWEIAPAATVESLGMGGDVIITQKAPVDDVFDTRYGIGPNGSGSTEFLSQEIAPTMNPVWEAFRAAHNGQWPDDTSQLLPYATTPEQQAALQKLMLKKSAGN